MDISYRWLQALVPGLEDAPTALAERLAMCGAPVDAIEALGEPLRDVKIARVVEARRHPNADRLSVCEVDAGTGELLHVVCGAPNVKSGGVYPFAPAGATLPGGITIKRAKIRGEESNGMLCSARELGIGREHEGILELHGEFTPGASFIESVGLDDWRLVLDIGANRPDLLSHLGVAREIAPAGVAGVVLPAVSAAADGRAAALDAFRAEARVERVPESGATDGVRITIEDPARCPRYIGIVLRGITVGPSPEWLATRLRAVGLRPINNIVDATNYVLQELGQPLHAFDLARLGGPEIRVRTARPGESIVTLDGEKRTLAPDMLVIADAAHPVAVAGVMGGEHSEVTAETRDVLLECALFQPLSVRRTRKALGLSTDASYRYERGVDPEGMERAARRAVELMLALAGGRADSAILDVNPRPYEAPVVALRPARATKVLGVPFAAGDLAPLLEPLGFQPVDAGEDAVRYRVPGWRSYDVTREVDLIEEVARRYGYNRFPQELGAIRASAVPENAVALLEDRLRTFLVGRGFLESRTMGLAAEAEGDVALSNPLSSAESRLRRALLPALVHRVEHNFARGLRDIRLFEIGTVFAPGEPGGVPVEETRLALIFTGGRQPPHWSAPSEATDVWDLKGLLVELAAELNATAGVVEAGSDDPLLAPDLSFHVPSDSGFAGHGGRIAPARIDAPAWAGAVWGLELPLDAAAATPRVPLYREIPAFPAIERDLALLVTDAVPAARVEALIRDAGGANLQAVAPFDLYRGPGIPEGTRSIAYRLRFRASDRTLTDKEVEQATARVLRRLQEELGVERR